MKAFFRRWINHTRIAQQLMILGLLAAANANGQPLTIQVLDHQGKPFQGAVVELQHPDVAQSSELPQAAMDQINKQFAPYLLVVEQGTPVVFPNSDSIKHHVFSFSAAKRFQLRLYKDQRPEPLIFDKPGVVALGCNIHDWMVGYIYVAQSKLYSQSDAQGFARFEVPERDYKLRVWHPRFKGSDAQGTTSVKVGSETVTFALQQSLHPILDGQADEFDSY